jgi:excisionase family DNA binding protein
MVTLHGYLRDSRTAAVRTSRRIQMARSGDFLSVPATARKLGCTLRYVYDLVYAGRLKAEKVTGRWRIPLSEIEAIRKKRGE